MSAIAVENVSKHWTTADGQVRAVDAITFALEPGTLNVLLGPSGCGKSTTLRLIAGLEAADGGRITIGSEDIAGKGAGDIARIGVRRTFQTPKLTALRLP